MSETDPAGPPAERGSWERRPGRAPPKRAGIQTELRRPPPERDSAGAQRSIAPRQYLEYTGPKGQKFYYDIEAKTTTFSFPYDGIIWNPRTLEVLRAPPGYHVVFNGVESPPVPPLVDPEKPRSESWVRMPSPDAASKRGAAGGAWQSSRDVPWAKPPPGYRHDTRAPGKAARGAKSPSDPRPPPTDEPAGVEVAKNPLKPSSGGKSHAPDPSAGRFVISLPTGRRPPRGEGRGRAPAASREAPRRAFSEEIASFYQRFNSERCMIIPALGVNAGTLAEIHSECQSIVASSAQLCRQSYFLISRANRPIEPSLHPLREFKVLSLGEGMRLFDKPPHKERYSHLIHHLATNSELLAQIIYFNLSTASILPDDDKTRFIFATLPAVFNFYLHQTDRENGLALIDSVFRLHGYLHGQQISRVHAFLGDLVFSFFLAANPGAFFEVSVRPQLQYLARAHEFDYERLAGGGIARPKYWNYLGRFAGKLLSVMRLNIPLLPSAVIAIVRKVIEMGDLRYSLVLDGLFLRYIQLFTHFDQPDILADLFAAIRCLYPQQTFPARRYKDIAGHFGKPASLEQFLSALACAEVADSTVTGALDIAGRQSAYTGRDLGLLWRMVSSFTDWGDACQLKQFAHLLSNIGAPSTGDDEKYIVLVAWGSSDTGPSKLDLREIRHFDDLVDGLNMVNMSQLEFRTPSELVNQLLRFSSQFLDVGQRLRLGAEPDLLLKVHEALDGVHENRQRIQDYGDSLCQELYWVRWQRERNEKQVTAVSKLYAERVVLPSLFEQLPDGFRFGASDLIGRTPVLVAVRANAEAALRGLGLAGDAFRIVRRAFIMEFVNRLNSAQQAQQPANWEPASKLFATFLQQKKVVARNLAPEKCFILKTTSRLFKNIKRQARMGVNLAMLTQAMALLQACDDVIVCLAIAFSQNLDLFGLRLFAKGFLMFQNDVTACILTDDDQTLLRRFAKALELIQLTGGAPC
jgi:hypothetical protein